MNAPPRGSTIGSHSADALPPQYTVIGTVTKGYDTTVQALENLADPLASNGVPPLAEIVIESVTIAQS